MPAIKATPQPMTPDRCLDWCIRAYIDTKTNGYFIASKFDMPGTEVLLWAATKAGLVLEQPVANLKRPRKVWHDILAIPNKADATKLFNKYHEEQQASRDRAKAAKAAKAKAKAVISKPAEKTFKDMQHEGTNVHDRLTRIEARLDKLLYMWDEDSTKK